MLDDAARRGVKELLVLTGERPEVNAEVARRLLREYGHEDFTAYVAWACERALERGHAAAHQHRRRLARGAGPAARGDGVAGADARVDEPRPGRAPGLADQAPGAAARDDPRGGRAEASRSRAGILVGIGESPEERIAALEAIAAAHAEYGHMQEVILQNFVPHPRYYGRRWRRSPTRRSAASAQVAAPSCRRPTGPARSPRRHAPARARVPPADARRRRADPAEPLRLVAARSSRRAPPTSAGCRRTATTSRRSTRSRRRTGCASSSRRAATRSPSGSASTRSTWTRSGSSRACST